MSGRSNHQITQVSVLLLSQLINSCNYCIVSTRFHFSEKPKEQDLLVIPLKSNQRTSAALASLRNLQNTLNDEEDAATEDNVKNGTTQPAIKATATLEERVVNELLAEARNEDVDNEDSATILTLPLNQDEPVLDGAKESSIGDYENIPIAQFGMAMLRGMGLKDEEIRAKNAKEPELRPRGMGLGADKLAKPKKLLVAPAANETLEIKKNACVRILAGKYKDLYGQVISKCVLCDAESGERITRFNSLQIEGLDDHAGRVIVKMALGGAREALNEFMVQPVSKQEYAQYGKVINSAKYDEYKKKQEDAEKMKAEGRSKDSAEATSSSRRRRSVSREEKSRRSRSRDDRDDNRRDSRQNDHRSSNRRNDERRHSPPRNRDQRRSRSRDRRNRSTERQSYRNDKNSSSSSQAVKYDDRAKSSKYDKNRSQSSHSASSSSTSSSDSPSSPRNRSSHKKHSKKKSKKSSKSHRDQSDDDRHVKKKTKKSKRQRSRSRGRN